MARAEVREARAEVRNYAAGAVPLRADAGDGAASGSANAEKAGRHACTNAGHAAATASRMA